jgi:hypothetical protein
MPDGAAHCRHAPESIRPGRKDNVVTGVWKIIKEGDLRGDPADVPTAQLREDDQSVVCPRVITDDQQGTVGRDTLDAVRRDPAAPVGQRPFAGFGEAGFSDQPVKVQAQSRKATYWAAEQDPEQAEERLSPGQAGGLDEISND